MTLKKADQMKLTMQMGTQPHEKVIDDPSVEDVEQAMNALGVAEHVILTLRSERKRLEIILTDNDDRVQVYFSDGNGQTCYIVDLNWSGDKFCHHYYVHYDGLRKEMSRADHTVPKEIATGIANHYLAHEVIGQVDDPYIWNGNCEVS